METHSDSSFHTSDNRIPDRIPLKEPEQTPDTTTFGMDGNSSKISYEDPNTTINSLLNDSISQPDKDENSVTKEQNSQLFSTPNHHDVINESSLKLLEIEQYRTLATTQSNLQSNIYIFSQIVCLSNVVSQQSKELKNLQTKYNQVSQVNEELMDLKTRYQDKFGNLYMLYADQVTNNKKSKQEIEDLKQKVHMLQVQAEALFEISSRLSEKPRERDITPINPITIPTTNHTEHNHQDENDDDDDDDGHEDDTYELPPPPPKGVKRRPGRPRKISVVTDKTIKRKPGRPKKYPTQPQEIIQDQRPQKKIKTSHASPSHAPTTPAQQPTIDLTFDTNDLAPHHNPNYFIDFSGFKDTTPNYNKSDRQHLRKIVHEMGGRIHVGKEREEYDQKITHVIAPPGTRTLKTLGAAIQGKWILDAKWLLDCQKANKFVREDDYGFKHELCPFNFKTVFLTPAFKEDVGEKNVGYCEKLIFDYGGGIRVELEEDSEIVLISKKEMTDCDGDNIRMNWEETLEYIYPKQFD
ncbi:PAX-interacting protein [Acrasis kona]|uniref:PAX-interacting protein n=1 Tax=Acrasis kona TaxID=1008807 RepID=A0AAW2ZIA3_9EUKA